MAKLSFAQKNIIVAGASKGIGRSTAIQLAEQGANVFLLARTEKLLEEVQSVIAGAYPEVRCEYAVCDITDKSQIKKAVEKGFNTFGSFDGLINNAGFAYPDYFLNTPIERFEESIQVDYLGAVHTTYHVLPHMRDGGFISFTSSVLGYMGAFGYTSYTGPKFALIGFASSLRQEVAEMGISINVLCPPDTDTPGYAEENKTKPPETRALSESAKLMSADDVAAKFLKEVRRRRFIINCNFESALFYRLQRFVPELVFKVMMSMVRKAQKNKQS